MTCLHSTKTGEIWNRRSHLLTPAGDSLVDSTYVTGAPWNVTDCGLRVSVQCVHHEASRKRREAGGLFIARKLEVVLCYAAHKGACLSATGKGVRDWKHRRKRRYELSNQHVEKASAHLWPPLTKKARHIIMKLLPPGSMVTLQLKFCHACPIMNRFEKSFQ